MLGWHLISLFHSQASKDGQRVPVATIHRRDIVVRGAAQRQKRHREVVLAGRRNKMMSSAFKFVKHLVGIFDSFTTAEC
jgi:hypothetical protein